MGMAGKLAKGTSRGNGRKELKVVGAQVQTIHGVQHGGDLGRVIADEGVAKIGHGMIRARSARVCSRGGPTPTGPGQHLMRENLHKAITVKGNNQEVKFLEADMEVFKRENRCLLFLRWRQALTGMATCHRVKLLQ
jgi:hypothetical protein